jgi:hypothetical protein
MWVSFSQGSFGSREQPQNALAPAPQVNPEIYHAGVIDIERCKLRSSAALNPSPARSLARPAVHVRWPLGPQT